MKLKLSTRNAERRPADLRRIDAECPHLKLMRMDDKSHELWIAGYILGGQNLVLLQCDDCAAEMDSVPEFVWRIPYKMVSEEEAKHLLRSEPHAEAVSDYGKRLQQEVFDELEEV